MPYRILRLLETFEFYLTLVLIVLIIILLCGRITYAYKRFAFVIKMRVACKRAKSRYIRGRSQIVSLFTFGSKFDFYIDNGDIFYRVKYMNVVRPRATQFVVYDSHHVDMDITRNVSALHGWGSLYVDHESLVDVSRVIIKSKKINFPNYRISEENIPTPDGRKVIDILLFSRAPRQINVVDYRRGKAFVGYNGDKLSDDVYIYSHNGFLKLIKGEK